MYIYGSFFRQLKSFYFNNAFSMLLGHARASDSMFYPLTLCALQIVFLIMIIENARAICGQLLLRDPTIQKN